MLAVVSSFATFFGLFSYPSLPWYAAHEAAVSVVHFAIFVAWLGFFQGLSKLVLLYGRAAVVPKVSEEEKV